jgi:hypothetical protein
MVFGKSEVSVSSSLQNFVFPTVVPSSSDFSSVGVAENSVTSKPLVR